MSGSIVIIISQDPDLTAPVVPNEAKAEKAGTSRTIHFENDDTPTEVGLRVAKALARMRREK